MNLKSLKFQSLRKEELKKIKAGNLNTTQATEPDCEPDLFPILTEFGWICSDDPTESCQRGMPGIGDNGGTNGE